MASDPGEVRARVARLRKVVAATPESARAHLDLGTALARSGALAEAEKELDRALDLEPEMPEALVNLGGVRLSRWDFRGCVEVNRRARERRPRMMHAHYNEGLGHLYLGEAVEMVECFRRVLDLDPGNPGGHYHLAVGLHAVGQTEEAKRHLAVAIELGFHPEPDFLKAIEKASGDAVPTLEIGGSPGPAAATSGDDGGGPEPSAETAAENREHELPHGTGRN